MQRTIVKSRVLTPVLVLAAVVALALAVLDILLVINLIVFVHRAKKREECTQPLSNSCCEAHAGR